jgi:DNA-3-methyladenine glycosylase II
VSRFTITPAGPFSLAASTRFLEGFAPAGYAGKGSGHLDLAFPVERDWHTAGVHLEQRESGRLAGEVVGEADPDAVKSQVARILSLDVDGGGFEEVGRRDPVVRRLQRRYAGLRPVTFWSPYEAAAWTVISGRIRITQAAAIKARITERFGERVELHGETLAAFPAPARLAGLDSLPGVPGRKLGWLHGVAAAALDGRLDAARLRSLPAEQALDELRELPGVGEFSAELILVRGAGDPDWFPGSERRLSRAMADAYGLGPEPDPARLREIAEGWRPYRSWVSVLLRTQLEDDTHGTAGR